jgi:hypothetical protein
MAMDRVEKIAIDAAVGLALTVLKESGDSAILLPSGKKADLSIIFAALKIELAHPNEL